MRSAPPPMRPARFYLAADDSSAAELEAGRSRARALDEANVQRERAEAIEEARPLRSPAITSPGRWRASGSEVLLAPVRTGRGRFLRQRRRFPQGHHVRARTRACAGDRDSLTLINEAPRFDQLCQALRERRAPGSTPLVTLKAGDGLPPVFFIHGVGGNVVEILPAARRMAYPAR